MGSVSTKKPHAVCVPIPAQGHVNPMMQLAKLLHSRGFHITFVNTEFNHKRLVKSKGPDSDSVKGLPDFRFETIPDGLPPDDRDATQDAPALCESIQKNCLVPFKELLLQLNSSSKVPPVTCVVADAFRSFCIKAAEEFGIPEVQFCPISACAFLGFLHYRELVKRGIFPFKAVAFRDPLGISDHEAEMPEADEEDMMPPKRPKVTRGGKGKKQVTSVRTTNPCLLVDEEEIGENPNPLMPSTFSVETNISASHEVSLHSARSLSRDRINAYNGNANVDHPCSSKVECQQATTQTQPVLYQFDGAEATLGARPRVPSPYSSPATATRRTFGQVTRPSPVGAGSSSQFQPPLQTYDTVDDFEAYFSQIEAGFDLDPLMGEPVDVPTSSSHLPDIEGAKKLLVAVVSRDLSEMPSLAADVTDAMSVLVDHHDLSQEQINHLRSVQSQFPTLISDFQLSSQKASELSSTIHEKLQEQESLIKQEKENVSHFRTLKSAHVKETQRTAEIEREMERLKLELTETTRSREELNTQMKEIYEKNVKIDQQRKLVSKEIPRLRDEKAKEDEKVAMSKKEWDELRSHFVHLQRK